MIYFFRPATNEAAFAKQRLILKKAQTGVSSPKGSKTIKDNRVEQK